MSEFNVNMYERFLIPEGSYEAVISSMDFEKNKFTDKKQIVIHYTLTDPAFDDHENSVKIHSYYSLTLHPKSNLLNNFVAPMLGRKPEQADFSNKQFDLGQFIGQDCTVEIEHLKKDDDDVVAKVKKVQPRSGEE